MADYILSIDQGTSSTKTIIFNEEGKAVARGVEPLKTAYTDNGFAEQVPQEIYDNVLASVVKCLDEFLLKGLDVTSIKGCGISNQRETFVLWDREGNPLYNAVVWQCKRSVNICQRLQKNGTEDIIKQRTGLLIDPYFSGTKITWLNENIPTVSETIANGNAYFGTIDTWLLFKLTKGQSYYTDYTNASRTLLFNLHTLQWDNDMLDLLGLKGLNLPQLKHSAATFGTTDFDGLLPINIPVAGMIGDSHAAAFGEGCFAPGYAKATLGTGCSVMMNIGSTPQPSSHGMVTTICWSIDGRIDYALEGVIVSCGSTIEWLKNELNLIADSKQTEAMANAVADNNGVYLIPAFSGMGAPHWRMDSKASITGLTFDCNKNHIVRAALEAIPYQIKDVIEAMKQDAGIPLLQLKTDGGISGNRFVTQFIADLLGNVVERIEMSDVSALGAAYMAGLQVGVYKDIEHLKILNAVKEIIEPVADNSKVLAYYQGWQNAIATYLSK